MKNIPDVDHLLALHDTAFIESLYAALLARAPDPGGLAYYLARLRSGIGKEEIIIHVATSEEARSKQLHLPGLDELLESQRQQRNWLQRVLLPDDTHARRKIARLENALGDVAQRFEALEQKLDNILANAPLAGATGAPGRDTARWPMQIPANQSPLEATSRNWPEKSA